MFLRGSLSRGRPARSASSRSPSLSTCRAQRAAFHLLWGGLPAGAPGGRTSWGSPSEVKAGQMLRLQVSKGLKD